MKSEITRITPELAKQWLERNVQNRPLKKSTVAFYARQIKEGKWLLNGEAIKFNGKVLLDGQHRLQAIVDAGIPIESLVIFDVPSSAFQTLDTGRPRYASDVLAIAGEQNTTNLGAAVRYLYHYRKNQLRSMTTAHHRPTNDDVIRTLKENPGIRDSLGQTNRIALKRLVPHSLLSFLHFAFSEIDPTLTERYFDTLETGLELAADSPVYLLRERLIQNQASKGKLSTKEVMALMIKTWNHTRTGEKRARLAWRNTGDKPEEFPIPV